MQEQEDISHKARVQAPEQKPLIYQWDLYEVLLSMIFHLRQTQKPFMDFFFLNGWDSIKSQDSVLSLLGGNFSDANLLIGSDRGVQLVQTNNLHPLHVSQLVVLY